MVVASHLKTCCGTVLKALLVFLVIGSLFPKAALPASPKAIYFKAESCYRDLRNHPEKQKYRHHWLGCIKQFESVYRADPDGPWAAAGLYMTGVLYRGLYGRSYLASDRQEAVDHFERIVNRFPHSKYRGKAVAQIKEIEKTAQKKTPSVKKGPVDRKWERAERCYRALQKNVKGQKYRDRWLICIDQYEAAAGADPTGPHAAGGLYMSGRLYGELYKRSYRKSDRSEAVDRYRRVIKRYPESPYAEKAALELGSDVGKAPAAVATGPPAPAPDTGGESSSGKGDETATAPAESLSAAAATGAPAGTVSVTGLRFWSNPSYTRVVIDADGEADFTHRLLKKDPSIQKPQRLFVDLDRSILSKDLERTIPINDDLLSDVRAGQYTPESVRVVIDIQSFETYKIFSLRNPFRVVIDVWGKSDTAEARGAVARSETPKGKDLQPGALARSLALGVRRIVVDPGHGGRDYGAPGYLKGVHEKNIVLSIGKRLAAKIEKELGCEVLMTRTNDRYLTLEERTAFANTKNADLFISIHTNSHRDRRAYGLETYFLNLATDNESIMVAATENATSEKNISDLQTILLDLMQNSKINESSRLATHVQESMYGYLKRRYGRVKSKGVKQAPFYVLLGAQMPSILIETSFISNKRECKRLIDPAYQDHLCEGIIKGIRQYIKDLSPTAFAGPAPGGGPHG